MKKIFKTIRDKDFDLVRTLIENKEELVNCVAKQPPKKDDGQSPLQVALKTGALDIAEYLIDCGADLNYMEDESCCNEWRTPVIHDAINAAVMKCRWNTNDKIRGFIEYSTEKEARKAYEILEKMLKLGADVNKLDSYGNSGIWRFCLQANQILPTFNYSTNSESDDRIFTKELENDLLNVLNLLCKYGADISYVSPDTKRTVRDFYLGGSLSKLLSQI